MPRSASQSASDSGGSPAKVRRTPSRRTWSPLSAWLGLGASQKAAAAAASAAGSSPSGSIPWTVLSSSPCRSSAGVGGRWSSSKLSKKPITALSVPSGSTIAVASRTASEIVGIVSRLPGFTRPLLPHGPKTQNGFRDGPKRLLGGDKSARRLVEDDLGVPSRGLGDGAAEGGL